MFPPVGRDSNSGHGQNALILVNAMPKLQSLFLPWASAKTLSNRYEINYLRRRRRWLAEAPGNMIGVRICLPYDTVDLFLLNQMTRKSRLREMIYR